MQNLTLNFNGWRTDWQDRCTLLRELGTHSGRKLADLGFRQDDLPAWVTGQLVSNRAPGRRPMGAGR